MLSDTEIYDAFNPLWHDIESEVTYPTKRPLLAHYTSIATLERIINTNEVWFSNPLYMNDMEELRFGMVEGAAAFRKHGPIKAACSATQYKELLAEFERHFDEFNNKHAFDTYVFCMAEHDQKTTDGLLSMWRGYGGNGNGAAIIFDTAQFNFQKEDGVFILSHVTYASKAERLAWIDNKLLEFAMLLSKARVPAHKLYLPMHSFFERLKIFSLFNKHHGFSEEREWRAVYLKERDEDKLLHGMLDYAIGRYGLEPKLKFKIQPIAGITDDDLSLEKIVSQILLGPSVSSPLAVMAVKRMLERVGKHKLAGRLTASTTPFRAM